MKKFARSAKQQENKARLANRQESERLHCHFNHVFIMAIREATKRNQYCGKAVKAFTGALGATQQREFLRSQGRAISHHSVLAYDSSIVTPSNGTRLAASWRMTVCAIYGLEISCSGWDTGVETVKYPSCEAAACNFTMSKLRLGNQWNSDDSSRCHR